jgi:hypothetical protein
MRHKLLFLVLPLFLIVLHLAAPLRAEQVDYDDAYFSDLIITTSKTHLLFFGIVNNGINDEMLQGLHNGIPIHFTFLVELNKVQKNWPDLQLASLKLHHTLTYDTLQENYRVEASEKKQKSESFRELSEAIKAMNEINGLQVVELSQLIPETSYQLRLKAILYENNLPMKLHRIIPFTSWWNVETDWQTVEFTY